MNRFFVVIAVMLALILSGCATIDKPLTDIDKPPTDDDSYVETIRIFNWLNYPVTIMLHSGDIELAPGVSTQMQLMVDGPHDTIILRAYIYDLSRQMVRLIGTTQKIFVFSKLTRGKKRYVWYINTFTRHM